MLTVIVAVDEFPARSNAVPEIIWFKPSFAKKSEFGHEAIPDIASEQLKSIWTLVLFQPNALGSGAANSMIDGGSLSTPTTVIVSDAPGLPRSSTATALLVLSVTARSKVVICGSKSLGPKIGMPLIEITALATPSLSMCSVNCVSGFSTVKLSVTVCGAPDRRRYATGPNAFQVHGWWAHVAVVSVGERDAVCANNPERKPNMAQNTTILHRQIFIACYAFQVPYISDRPGYPSGSEAESDSCGRNVVRSILQASVKIRHDEL